MMNFSLVFVLKAPFISYMVASLFALEVINNIFKFDFYTLTPKTLFI